MKRFTWWRMEQDAHHLSRALCGAFCSILHHVKRFLSQPPQGVGYLLSRFLLPPALYDLPFLPHCFRGFRSTGKRQEIVYY